MWNKNRETEQWVRDESKDSEKFNYDDFVKIIAIGEIPENAEKVVALFYMNSGANELDLQKPSKPVNADVICAKEVN